MCAVLCLSELYPGSFLTTKEKARKISVVAVENCADIPLHILLLLLLLLKHDGVDSIKNNHAMSVKESENLNQNFRQIRKITNLRYLLCLVGFVNCIKPVHFTEPFEIHYLDIFLII
jgi:hypothetical protein